MSVAKLIVPGVAFMIASSPQTFKIMRSVMGNWVSSAEGVATFGGLFLHMLFFLLVLWLTDKYLPMIVPMSKRSNYGDSNAWGKGHETHRRGLGHTDSDIKGSPLTGVDQITNA